jgi:uncharacterized Zn finger protein (UPF0148 family)
MFEDTIRELKELQGQRVAVPDPVDEDGYLDRECPAEKCLFGFKVHQEDWRDKVRDEEVFCPFCGHAAPARQWATREQVEHLKTAALAQIQERLGTALRRDTARWNQRQPRNGFITMTMSCREGSRSVVVPAAAVEPMRLKISCPACSCRYAVIGAAFFCPACGHNAAELVFSQSLAGIRRAIEVLDGVRSAIRDRDAAATTVRLLTENGLQNAVTAFQRFAEAVYVRIPGAKAPRRNALQNLAEGSGLWQKACGKGYDTYLNPQELAALTRFFQQRHLLAHTEGIVDAHYIARAGDREYRVGQRIVIKESSVRECVTLIEKLAAGLALDGQAASAAP